MKTKSALLALLVMAIIIGNYSVAQAQTCTSTTGVTSGGTFSDNGFSGSSFSWSNPANAQTSDASYATGGMLLGALSSAYSDYLVIQGFGFSIPSSATICEIDVSVQRSVTGLGLGSYVSDKSVRLLKAGVPTGNDLANAAAWTGSDTYASYGGGPVSSVWGSSWNPSDVNSPNFGVAISASLNTGLISLFQTARINYVSVTIIYSPILLPVTVNGFSATRGQEGNLLSWTATAAVGETFHIQRSASADNWEDIYSLPSQSAEQLSGANPSGTGASGTGGTGTGASGTRQYSYIDRAPLNGPNYYRLRLENAGGASTYSAISVITGTTGALRCWPNPFTQTINISSAAPLGKVLLKDLQGRTITIKDMGSTACEGQLTVGDLPPGIYVLQAGASTYKLIKREN